jgi:low affinity Fe/Cu permease
MNRLAMQSAKPTSQVDVPPLFARLARWVERQVGRSTTFLAAIALVLLWAVSGPFFGWSDTWQLVINTGTTIVTFLMVFVIQNTQSRDTQAMQVKLDELIRVNEMARNSLINLEEMPDTDVERTKRTFAALASVGSQTSRPTQETALDRSITAPEQLRRAESAANAAGAETGERRSTR